MSSLIGQSLGRYHILEQLGEGGMATVYKAYDTRLERDVAIKIIRSDAFPPNQLERILKRFEREAKSLAKLSHPNIVSVIDFGEHEGVPYLVMVYLPGGTLKEKLGKSLPWAEAVRLLLPVAHALAYAHREGVIHRDVKPNNILLARSGDPMLTDFGIAKILDTGETQTLTGSGVGIGTPEYMAPEQGMGHGVDARVDIYSLGIVLYEMVTGRKPYTADTPMAVVLKQMTDPLPRPTDFNREIPPPVEKMLLKALAKKPQDRYESMNDFIKAMEACLIGKPAGVKSMLYSAPSAHIYDERTIDQVTTTPVTNVSGRKIWWILAAAFVVIAATAISILGWPLLATSSQKSAPGAIAEKSTTVPKLETTEPAATPTIEKTPFLEKTRTPYPSATNIPDGTVLFAEDFETGSANGFNNIYGDWKVISENNTNKVYEIDNQNNSDYAGINMGSIAWRNFAVEYRVKMLHHTSGAPEVILYFRANNEPTDGYVQALTPYWNDVLLAKQYNGSSWQDVTNHNFSFSLGRWYHVRVEAVGSRLKVFVEDKLLLDKIDTQFSSGALTFEVGPGAHVLLDDISVTTLEP